MLLLPRSGPVVRYVSPEVEVDIERCRERYGWPWVEKEAALVAAASSLVSLCYFSFNGCTMFGSRSHETTRFGECNPRNMKTSVTTPCSHIFPSFGDLEKRFSHREKHNFSLDREVLWGIFWIGLP